MMNEQRNTIWRFAIIFILILLGFIAVVVRIIYVQTAERDEWLRVAVHQEPTHKPISATRGNILDCHGNLLATSMPQYYMYMDTKAEALRLDSGKLFHQQVDALADDLARVLEHHSKDEYKQMLEEAYKKGNRQLKLCNDVDYLQRQKLEKNALIKRGRYQSGIYYEDRNERTLPYGKLASRTIGEIYGENGEGNVGLEKEFDNDLRGTDGVMRVEKIGGRQEAITVMEAQDGLDVVTTIDANLQDIVEQELEDKLLEKKAKWGCCILMETQTGYIRAIANLDRNKDTTYSERYNHAVTRVEPGSTFKTISLMTAMEDGLMTINDTVTVTKKSYYYMNRKDAEHTDSHPMDTVLTAHSALSISSNIAFAKFITRSYNGSVHKFVASLRKFGVDTEVYCEIPGALPFLLTIPKGDTVTISKMAYGYSVEMSPMQLIMFYNAIANNGRMMRPMLVTSVQRNGIDVRTFKPEVVKESICSPQTLQDVKGALHDVVWHNHLGTASVNLSGKRKAQSDIVAIAGKTGTAQLIIDKKHDKRHHRMTFVGYFPEDNPQYTCICMIEDPVVGSHDSGMECGVTVRNIAERTMAYTGCYIYRNGEKALEKR